jgi:hypothetical protein
MGKLPMSSWQVQMLFLLIPFGIGGGAVFMFGVGEIIKYTTKGRGF